jgi:mTERF domain-containing protein
MHATVIEKNPMLFKESLDSLNIRIDYLKSKKFTEEAIAEMVIKAPRILGLNVEKLDSKLGWFQNEFDLTASELRQIVHSRPKLITLPLKIISDVRFCLKEFLSFSDSTIKSFIKTYPKLFTKDFKIIEANYNYITKVMKLSDQQIINYPPILQAPLLLIKTRYAFLKHLDRLQFDPTLSNYIPVKSIIEPIETKFVEKYAKSNIIEYKKFLKSI